MASIRERTSKRGERSWAVLYRHGGKQTSLTFTDPREAEAFKALVGALGPDRALKALQAEAPAKSITVGELAERFLERKAADVTARTLADYRRDIDNWILPWFGFVMTWFVGLFLAAVLLAGWLTRKDRLP